MGVKYEVDRKALESMSKLQDKFGGLKPEYITMYMTHQVRRLMAVLISLIAILCILTGIHVYLLASSS
jgi:hypothetical protein